MSIREIDPRAANAPEQHYTEYTVSPSYVDRYTRTFNTHVPPDLNLADPDLRSRLDTPIADLLTRDGMTERVREGAAKSDLTVRDALGLGAYEGLFTLPGLDETDDNAVCTAVQAHVPELPLLSGAAPAEIIRILFDRPEDVPLCSVAGKKISVGDMTGREEADRFQMRLHALACAFGVDATPPTGESGGATTGPGGVDEVATAIGKVLRTFE